MSYIYIEVPLSILIVLVAKLRPLIQVMLNIEISFVINHKKKKKNQLEYLVARVLRIQHSAAI